MYYPKKQRFYDPAKFNLTFEDIYFIDNENQKIHAWWFPAKTKSPKGTWIYFHGNAENLTTHFSSLSWLPDTGYNYFIFDYPGYGESEGEPSPYQNVQSGMKAIEWVHDNKDKSPLIIYGQSMGGIVALRAAIDSKNKIPIKAVIADGTFSSFQRIARKKLSQHWLTWILQPLVYVTLSDRWAPNVENLSPTPLIVLHGEDDKIVEIEHGRRLFEDAKEPKVFLTLPGGGHGNLFWIGDRSFRKKVLNAIPTGPTGF